jgi:two-component system, cell cycle sensor histidine kinase and response regulator CckA
MFAFLLLGTVLPRATAPLATVLGFSALAASLTVPFLGRRQRTGGRCDDDRDSPYQRLCELSGDIVFEEDVEGRIRSVNAKGARLVGYEPDALVGCPFQDLLEPPHREQVRDARRQLLAERDSRSVSLEVNLRTAGGGTLGVDLRSALAYAGDTVVGFLSVARNVTERRRLEAQLRQSQKMEAVGRLAGGVAHDFNNMLTAMMGFAELARMGLHPAHPSSVDLQRVIESGQRAGDLVRQLLAFSRRQVLQPAVVDPTDALRALTPMLPPLLGADIRLQTRLHPETGCIRVDPSQLSQVLMNLAVNARDAMPRGGTLTIETSNVMVGPGVERGGAPVTAGSYVVLTVADTGCGMDEATRARIFEPFFTTKPEGEGTGLGLATVYGIVKQSGGYIWVESEPGQGSRFEIYLPRAARNDRGSGEAPCRKQDRVRRGEPGARPTVDQPRVEQPPVGTETLLIAEDDVEVRKLIERSLTELGYRVLSASDGESALASATEHQADLDLLLTDLVLPALSGIELAARVRQLRPDVKVLFMSGDAAPPADATPVVDDPLVQKPFTTLGLALRLRELLDVAPCDRYPVIGA